MNDNVRRTNPVQSKPNFAKGHDAILKALQERSKQTTIITLAGERFDGVITGRDKFTITLQVESGIKRVFYKHAIEQFYSVDA